MSEPNLNPHIKAQLELEYWEAQGIRHTFDPELVVLADLYPNGLYPDKYLKKQ